jgi:hypothetical protein
MMGLMTLTPDGLDARSWAMAASILEQWPTAGAAQAEQVRESVVRICRASEAQLSPALLDFLEVVPASLQSDQPWSDTPIGHLLRGLYSVARQYLRTPATQQVLELCNDIRTAVDDPAKLTGHPNELLAALMVVEDAVAAIAGYDSTPPFTFVDEAYLAKFGLLQALQLSFDGAEAVARMLGTPLRADGVSGGKAVKIARNIVAGHPIGGTMAGESWHHFHDRSTAHDKAVIRVMSFSRADPDNWTGQTLQTDELIADGLSVIAEVLRRALGGFGNPRAGTAVTGSR